jgi:hypothetical protein
MAQQQEAMGQQQVAMGQQQQQAMGQHAGLFGGGEGAGWSGSEGGGFVDTGGFLAYGEGQAPSYFTRAPPPPPPLPPSHYQHSGAGAGWSGSEGGGFVDAGGFQAYGEEQIPSHVMRAPPPPPPPPPQHLHQYNHYLDGRGGEDADADVPDLAAFAAFAAAAAATIPVSSGLPVAAYSVTTANVAAIEPPSVSPSPHANRRRIVHDVAARPDTSRRTGPNPREDETDTVEARERHRLHREECDRQGFGMFRV